MPQKAFDSRKEGEKHTHRAPAITALLLLACKNIDTLGLNLNICVRWSFNALLNVKACGPQIGFHLRSLKEDEIQRYLFAPQFIDMSHLLALMKGEQEQSLGSQHTPKLLQDRDHC